MPPRQGYRKFAIDLLAWKRLAGLVGLFGLAFTLSLALLGCGGGGGGSASTPTVNLSQNYHPSGWISSHPGSAIAGLDACTKCHQLAVAAAGSNVPTCTSMLCHHKTLPAWGTAAIHGTRAKLAAGTDGGSLVSCQICHGKDFTGGVAAKSCASCHGVAAPHPAKPWHDAAGSNHATTNPANAAVCAQCHFPGAPANPVGHPATPAPAGTAPGCTNNTLCHGTIQATHQVPFLSSEHTGVTQAGFSGTCATCHAVSGASPVVSAPLCSACHQAGSPLTVASCASCHEKPPTGASFPNVAGAHGKHNALAGVAGTCATCHQGADTGSLTHYNHADGRPGMNSLRTGPGLVAFLSAYSGNAGPATFNPTTLTCSNVSCHGGQTTPAWTASGSLNTAADCTKCHALGTAPGLPESNSAYSGFHALHMNSSAKLLCTECHNMANGSSGALGHLTNLGTAAMEGVAAETIVLTGGSYSPTAKTCTIVCHGKTHASYTWAGNGGVHPAGWIASHPGSALAGLSTCKICHGAQLTGGPFSEPGCFTAACHHNTQPGYALAGSHGLRAKLGQSTSGGGLASCQACHGTNFASGLTASDGTTKACTTCHGVAAPHPAKPWHNTSGSNHATTDATNAPVCAQCHYPGAVANPAGHPATPAPAGTAPGCFNNTLCHGAEAAPHALGSVWTTATSAAFHGIAAKKDLASCQGCHGNPGSTGFEGGAAAATKCSSCHVQARAHADRWVQAPGAFPAYAASHRDAGNRAVACALCHDGTKGRIAPDATAPSCFSASANAVACHVNGPGQPNHAVPFLGGAHVATTAATFTSDCSSCHAISGTSPAASAPLCSTCHRVADPTLTATGTGTCLSCHSGTAGLPAGPGGASFPSIAGAHAKHMVLPTALTCDTCHAGSGSGTATHYANSRSTAGPAPVVISSSFNSKAAIAAFTPSALTCSNVSCHGGQATPAWTTAGSINSATDCTKCHSVAASADTVTNFNDAFGRHALGTHNAATLANGIACTTCHSMTNGSSGAVAHFKYLNTPAVDGTATGLPADQQSSGTIVFDAAIVTGSRTYSVTSGNQGNGGCALTCHTHLHTAAASTWTASGTPHPVPFGAGQTDTQNNGHFTASATTFSSDCSSCHAISGTSPAASAPLCTSCHRVADPTLTATGTGTCLSCHSGTAGLPAGPGGASFPSIAGAHAKHMVLPTTLTCDTCHAGSGSGTATHYANSRSTAGPAPVAISSTFNSKAATAAFSPAALTCSNVSCHGGQATPAWTTAGSINSATDCTKCHSVSLAPAGTQYNNAFGRHSMGTHNATAAGSTIACTTCHSMTNGSSGALAHFKYLNTPAVDGTATGLPADQLPSGTLVFDTTIVTGARTYSATSGTQGNGGCALTCHNHIHTPTYETWTASGSAHPVPFLSGQNDSQLNGHLTVTAAAFTSDCAVCHAYTGSSPLVGAPLCSTCHRLADPTVLATGSGTCQSCHGGSAVPTLGPNGSGFPSIAGAHAKHMGLATQLTCDTCHAGSGSGTTTHYTNANARITVPSGPVPVAVSTTFAAKTGGSPAFTPASLTCSNVSCHGGQVTPGWQTGLLNSATDCTKCHGVATSAGTVTQFNDAFGRHSSGTHNATTAANAIACTTCHSMGNGSLGAQAHFKYLDTPAVDGVSTGSPADQLPGGTIAFDAAIVSGARTYSTTGATQGNGGCALTCHTHIHVSTVETWTASGAPHGIPFLAGQVDTQNNGHLTATQATFTADCGTCHATSGTSPVAGAPSCSICHPLANPVAVATGSGTCLSCHVGGAGLPVGPEGASYPSIAGSHGKHLALPTTLTCDTCHTGSGTTTATHYTNANARVATPTGPGAVALEATYNAQTGGSATFSPAALTCATVSCHGGKTTPAWTAANSIVSATDCTKCHAINGGSQPAQYNDALGRHSYGTHSSAGTADCTLCHDMSAANASIGAVKHFAELNSTNVGGSSKLPSGTIKFKTGNATYPISGTMTYSVTAPYAEGDGGCAVVCHAQTHTPTATAYHWNAPQGSGAAHPIPFLGTDLSTGGNPHQAVSLAQFNGECSNCHDQTGASTKSGPVCTVCHTLGSPLGTGMTAGTCLSCHVGAAFATQGPTGTAWPNLMGSHPKHLALSTFTRGTPALPTALASAAYPQCQACHFKSLPGDTNNTHYSNASKRVASPISSGPASVAVHATFNAQGGTAGFVSSASAFTCSNISCHGGQVTPGWQTGTLTVNANTYCITCHKITSTATQYNDATGRHNNPSAHNQTCDHCHDMSTATNNRTGVVNHFRYLDTTAVRTATDQLSSDTVKFGGGSTPATGALTYTVNATQGRGGCALSCHGQTHTTTGNIWN